jgi:hypothetical protein
MLPLKQKLSSSIYLYFYHRCCAEHDLPPEHLCQEDLRYKESFKPFVELSALIPLFGQEGAVGDHSHWVLEQAHKWVRHHIFIQNFKTLGLCIVSLINCPTSTFLSNVGLNSLTFVTTISSSGESPIHYVTPQIEAIFIHTLYLYRCCCAQWDSPPHHLCQVDFRYIQRAGRTLRRTINSNTSPQVSWTP